MRSPRKSSTAIVAALLMAAVPFGKQAAGQAIGVQDDGWHTWQVQAVPGTPDLCCYGWQRGDMSQRGCKLDSRSGGFGSAGAPVMAADKVNVYALLKGSRVSKILALSASCPVTANSDITDLGVIAADDSVAWLQPLVANDTRDSSGAMAAIAVHAGSAARDILVDTASLGGTRQRREGAIFWMAQVRVAETADHLKKLIYEDQDPDIREHAAFAYAQSSALDVAEVLIRQGRNDADPDVRSQAWFWLADTGADESEAEIRHALLNDADLGVREKVVFALSQLPAERAVKELVRIIEDRTINIEIREQALFWLAQTESADAFAFIDSLLGSN